MITHEQYLQLLRPINGRRVSRDGKGFSHVEAYEIRAHLNRIFGFLHWDEEVTDQQVVFESQHQPAEAEAKVRGKWSVCYRSIVRLTVRCPYGCHVAVFTEGACGDAQNQPSRADAHDLALKTSQSQAFKRAAVNLGDQFGLSLYNKGSLSPLVGKSLVHPHAPQGEEEPAAAVDAHITTQIAPENGETETPTREVSTVQTPPAGPPAPAGEAMDRIRTLTTFPRGAAPDTRMRAVREAMAIAIEHALVESPTQAGITLGAWLNAELQKAHREIEATAKVAS